MTPEERAQAVMARMKKPSTAPIQQPQDGAEPIRIDVPQPRMSMTSMTPRGPQYEVFDPALEMAKKGSDGVLASMGALDKVNTLFTLADENVPAMETGSSAQGAGMMRQFGRSSIGRFAGIGGESGEKARLFHESKKGFLGELARAISSERGVLTNQDIQRIEELMPSEYDSVYTRQNKRKLINDIVQNSLGRYNKLTSMIGKKKGRTLSIG